METQPAATQASSSTSYCYTFARPSADATPAQAAAAAAAARRAAAQTGLRPVSARGAPNGSTSASPSSFSVGRTHVGTAGPTLPHVHPNHTTPAETDSSAVPPAHAPDADATRVDGNGSSSSSSNSGGFVCHICLGPPLQRPVVTRCGHLFCWECLDAWAVQRGHRTVPCPYCKGAVDVDQDATPILGVGDGGGAASASSSSRPVPPARPHADNGDEAHPNRHTPPRAHRAAAEAAPPPRPQRRPEAHVPPPRGYGGRRWAFGAAPAFGFFSYGGGGTGVFDNVFTIVSICLIGYTLYTLYQNYTARNAERRDDEGNARANRFGPDMAAEADAERQRRRMRLRQMPGLEGLFLRTLDALGINVDDDSSVRGVVACAGIALFFLFMVVMSE